AVLASLLSGTEDEDGAWASLLSGADEKKWGRRFGRGWSVEDDERDVKSGTDDDDGTTDVGEWRYCRVQEDDEPSMSREAIVKSGTDDENGMGESVVGYRRQRRTGESLLSGTDDRDGQGRRGRGMTSTCEMGRERERRAILLMSGTRHGRRGGRVA